MAGLLFARWGVSFLVAILAGPGKMLELEPHFDLRVLGFHGRRGDRDGAALQPRAGAARDARRCRETRGWRRRDHSQPVSVNRWSSIQVTLSVLLLCGAALFLRTLHNLNSVPSGFDRDGVLTMQVEATVPGRTVPAEDS